jgi:hypothetical protein
MVDDAQPIKTIRLRQEALMFKLTENSTCGSIKFDQNFTIVELKVDKNRLVGSFVFA